jgi:hypothetical protein
MVTADLLPLMLAKFFASWLIVLVLVPFTAPFSICGLTGLFGSAQRRPHTALAVARTGSLRERRHRDEDVTTDVAVARVPGIFKAARVRLSPESGLPLAHTRISSSSARLMWLAGTPDRIREHSVLTTILRL